MKELAIRFHSVIRHRAAGHPTVAAVFLIALYVGGLVVGLGTELVAQQKIVELNNGVVLKGEIGTTSDFAGTSPGGSEPILFVDSKLRRVFTYKFNVRGTPTPSGMSDEIFEVDQYRASRTSKSGGIGAILGVPQPFNQYGRRMIRITGARGPVTLVQGITEITPLYCVLRTVKSDDAVYNGLEMRIATSSLPQSTLSQIMRHQINAANASARLKIVSFYQQAERYRDAEVELQTLLRDFPELAEEKQRDLKLMRQAWSNQQVRELKARINRGQYSLALKGIDFFPRKGVASEILLEVGELKRSIENRQARREQIVERVSAVAEKFAVDSKADVDVKRDERIALFVEEIGGELNLDNIARMAAFMTLSEDPSQTAEENLALAISGWLLGSDGSVANLEVALSLLQTRELVVQYLLSNAAAERETILEKLDKIEGSTPGNLARIIANLKPFLQSEPVEDKQGYFELQAPGIGDIESFNYSIQLPPDYNPYRRYPCVVTLNYGNGVEHQMEWWAGVYDPNFRMRRGQAAIHGYIVISVDWQRPKQTGYHFSIQEHAAVLNSVRDAYKRFAIDTDRVFLSGHLSGGTAAWDIGLAHPDMWAGVIPISARADKTINYISRYWKNPRHNLPMYFVMGERDTLLGDENNSEWTRYLENFGFDVMVVEYQGRGREHFYEDIHNIHEWMNLVSHRRVFAPEKFECTALRPWDSFFWFVEVAEFRKNSTVLPQQMPARKTSPTKIEGGIIEKNKLRVETSAEREIVWLAPEYIDFDREISINGRTGSVKPDVRTLLEDVRTRCDRQHPFWAKVDLSEHPWRR